MAKRLYGKLGPVVQTDEHRFILDDEWVLIAEQWMSHVASSLVLPAEQVRELNMYKNGDATPYGMVQVDCQIRQCWNTLKEKCSFNQRKVMVDNFNK